MHFYRSENALCEYCHVIQR